MDQVRTLPSRRSALILCAGAGIAALVAVVLLPRRFDGEVMDATAAHAAAISGAMTLIDIRRPDEWAMTGVGEGAQPLDMRETRFDEALLHLVEKDLSRPLALICARGGRSSRLAAGLAQAGHRRVIDVAEGMLGAAAGPGWIARGLPVRPG